jgi:hypothetical protein
MVLHQITFGPLGVKWLGENGGELTGAYEHLCVQNKGSLCTK